MHACRSCLGSPVPWPFGWRLLSPWWPRQRVQKTKIGHKLRQVTVVSDLSREPSISSLKTLASVVLFVVVHRCGATRAVVPNADMPTLCRYLSTRPVDTTSTLLVAATDYLARPS